MTWWISPIPPEEGTGALKKQYQRYAAGGGPVDHVVQAHSHLPKAMDALLTFYKGVMHGENDLPYVEREMIAVTVSILNRCHY